MKPAKIYVFNVSRGKVTINAGYCKGCGLCLVKCPQKSLQWSAYLGIYSTPAVELNPQTCDLCGQCALICPDSAVSVEYIPRPKR